MGIPLRIVEPFPPFETREPGMMWRYSDRDESGRDCWWIVLPDTSGDVREGSYWHGFITNGELV